MLLATQFRLKTSREVCEVRKAARHCYRFVCGHRQGFDRSYQATLRLSVVVIEEFQ